jgi:predicted glutamine amidotransferase
MAHLRWATLGLGIGPDNTHPFTDGRVAFAHNGSVRPPSSLDALVSPGLRGLRRGDTDSERYFLAVLSRLAEGAAPVEALARTVADVATAGAASSLNGLLLTPDALYAVAWSDPAAAAREGHAPDYYDLGLRRTADAVLVSSSGWGRDWRQLPDHTVTVVRRGSLEVTTVSLDEVLVA